MASTFQIVFLLLGTATAWPASMSCDYTCLSGKSPGGSFGAMGIANFGSVTGSNCVITTDVPASGFTAGTAYSVTVTSTTALAIKVGSDRAGFGGQSIVDSGPKVTSSTHAWTATNDASATLRALCGAGGSIDQMWVADAVTVSLATPATTTMGTTTMLPTTTMAGTTTGLTTTMGSTTTGPATTMGSTTTGPTTTMGSTTTGPTTSKGTTTTGPTNANGATTTVVGGSASGTVRGALAAVFPASLMALMLGSLPTF